MSLNRYLGSRKRAVERNLGSDRHRTNRLQGEALFSDIDAECGDRPAFEFKINQRLEFVAIKAPTVRSGRSSCAFHGFSDDLRFERLIENPLGARLECLTAAGPDPGRERDKSRFLSLGQKLRHADDLFGSLKVEV